MAGINHRKLYPTSEDNSTISCPDICDSTSTCPYGCYPYTDIYSAPPAVAPNLSAKHSQHISPFVIVIVTLLASGFFLVSSYFVMVRYCSRWSCFRQRQRQPEATEEEFLDENRGPAAVDHPIWYINTIGLQPSVIDSITIFTYKKGDYLIEGTECSVCLNEFRNDETLRLLPKCNHAFHIPCIDTWLRSHTNCPVCRAGIVSIAVTTPVASNRLNSNNLGLDEDSEGENSGNYEEFNTNQVIRDDEYCENRTNSREIIEVPQVRDDEQGADTAKMSITSKGNAASWVIGDLNNKSMIKGDNYEVRSVRRSVSVDSLLAVAECHDISVDQSVDVDHVSAKIFGGNSRTSRIISGGSSMAQFLHKRPVRMKRSFSYASGRSFLSKQYSRTDSVLPL